MLPESALVVGFWEKTLCSKAAQRKTQPKTLWKHHLSAAGPLWQTQSKIL